MIIWIDGDACPKPIKEILFRAARKQKILLRMVANHFIPIPASTWIQRIMVEHGFDKADAYILEQIQPYDLLITSDVILADLAVSKQALVLNPKGRLYTEDNMKQLLSQRHLNESLRSSGLISGGVSPLGPKEVQEFSNHLDKILTKYHR